MIRPVALAGLFYSSSGVGSTTHLSAEMQATQAAIKLTHVRRIKPQ